MSVFFTYNSIKKLICPYIGIDGWPENFTIKNSLQWVVAIERL